jgi:hypothetical protein
MKRIGLFVAARDSKRTTDSRHIFLQVETIRRVPQSTSAISSIVPELRQETNTALLLPAQVVRATLGRSPHVRMQAKWNLARLCASYEIQEASNEVVERESSS